MQINWDFYRGKRVFITGHTGFKGSWMCQVLKMLGADIYGYSLEEMALPSVYKAAGIAEGITSYLRDIRDRQALEEAMKEAQPEIVIHMAAQPLVRESYRDPAYTYEVNVMGTVNVLEAVRKTKTVRSLVNVTTDKVYKNVEWEWGYRETDELNGIDPYSNSKSCSELVTSSYKEAFFHDREIGISTCRAGNVIGGGDFAKDRIIPDCVRAALEHHEMVIRNPYSVRPFQFVLEPVMAYLLVAMAQYDDPALAGNYNIGPDEGDCQQAGTLAKAFCGSWKELTGQEIALAIRTDENAPREANFLKLDCSRAKRVFGWKPVWNTRKALEKTAEWTKCYAENGNIRQCMENQIRSFLEDEARELQGGNEF